MEIWKFGNGLARENLTNLMIIVNRQFARESCVSHLRPPERTFFGTGRPYDLSLTPDIMFTQIPNIKYVKKNKNYKVYAICAKCTPKRDTYHVRIQYFSNKNEEKNRECTAMCTLIRFIIIILLKTKPDTMIKNFNTSFQFSLNKAFVFLLIPKM